MWKKLQEASSVLPELKQITPSDRSFISGNEGIGDRSEIGKSPVQGQKKIWGNLDSQSRGLEGHLDTQGKKEPEMFTSKRGATKSNDPGTTTPSRYEKMYSIKESASANETGTQAGKLKASAAANPSRSDRKYVKGGDFIAGGSCGGCKKEPVTEAQVLGTTIAMVSAHALSEGFNMAPYMKRG